MAHTYVRARIDPLLKQQAHGALKEMGLSVSDAIRLMMINIVEEKRLPFTVKVPQRLTQQAIEELERGQVSSFSSPEALLKDLNEDA